MSILLLLLIEASLFAVGSSLFAMFVLVWRRPRRWYGYFAVKASVMLTIGTVMWRILLVRGIQLNWSDPFTKAYAFGVLLADVGMVIVTRDMMQHSGRRFGMGLAASSTAGPLSRGVDAADVPDRNKEE